jgi:hypothetical protein
MKHSQNNGVRMVAPIKNCWQRVRPTDVLQRRKWPDKIMPSIVENSAIAVAITRFVLRARHSCQPA